MAKQSDDTKAATKADINKLQQSTKADIQRLEKNIQRLEQVLIRKYATKPELKRVERNLRGEMLRLEEKVEDVQDGQKRAEAKLDKISNQLDGFVGRVDDLTTDNQVGANQIRELDIRVSRNEKRIAKLESTIQTK